MGPLHASIDIGSNSAKLMVASLDEGVVRPRIELMQSVRIGADHETLSPETLQRLREVLIRFRQTLSNTGAHLERVVMTGAIRRFADPQPAQMVVQEVLSREGEIISGEEEARLAWLAVRHRYGKPGFLALDVGAGSSELSTRNHLLSIPMGALTLAREFGPAPHPGEMRSALVNRLEEYDLRRFAGRPTFVSGGSACAVASLALGQKKFNAGEIERFDLDMELLDRMALRLRSLSDENRNSLPGLQDGRGEMVLPGLHLVEAILKKLNPVSIRVSTLGLRYGVLSERLLSEIDDPPELEEPQVQEEEKPPSPPRRRRRSTKSE